MNGILHQLLGLALTVITGAGVEADSLVVSFRPCKGRGRRCSECGRRRPRYDAGRGARSWRTLDLASTRRHLE